MCVCERVCVCVRARACTCVCACVYARARMCEEKAVGLVLFSSHFKEKIQPPKVPSLLTNVTFKL